MKQIDVHAFVNQASLNPVFSKFTSMSDTELQDYLLQGVSRTFALTIPQLPFSLNKVISNAYLLCRTIDTIEDEAKLTIEQKKEFSLQFLKVVTGKGNANNFSGKLSPLLSEYTLEAEKELVMVLPRIISIMHSFDEVEQQALTRCVKIMSRGMVHYQLNVSPKGLSNLEEHNAYCYHVAGVVGEMLTELFCHYSEEIYLRKEEMLTLAGSFGQGLQMTNILKDIWEDYERGVCWLPRDIFAESGFNLDNLAEGPNSLEFQKGLIKLIAIAHGHLKNALEYTLMIPSKEKGIRRFCLWALGMAILTLRKIYRNQHYTLGSQVKISRKSVKATIALSNLFVSNDMALKALFSLARTGLPVSRVS